jgi:hypothetical protein
LKEFVILFKGDAKGPASSHGGALPSSPKINPSVPHRAARPRILTGHSRCGRGGCPPGAGPGAAPGRDCRPPRHPRGRILCLPNISPRPRPPPAYARLLIDWSVCSPQAEPPGGWGESHKSAGVCRDKSVQDAGASGLGEDDFARRKGSSAGIAPVICWRRSCDSRRERWGARIAKNHSDRHQLRIMDSRRTSPSTTKDCNSTRRAGLAQHGLAL